MIDFPCVLLKHCTMNPRCPKYYFGLLGDAPNKSKNVKLHFWNLKFSVTRSIFWKAHCQTVVKNLFHMQCFLVYVLTQRRMRAWCKGTRWAVLMKAKLCNLTVLSLQHHLACQSHHWILVNAILHRGPRMKTCSESQSRGLFLTRRGDNVFRHAVN